VTSIRVFGSFARGDARPDSDLDLLIEAGPNRTPFFPGGLLMDLEEELGRKVDLATPAALHPLIRDQILGEAVPFSNRQPDTNESVTKFDIFRYFSVPSAVG